MQQIRELIVEINRQGTTVLLVEQNAAMALSIADHGYVLETGKVVMDRPAAELLEDSDVREFYLGLRRARARRSRSATSSTTSGGSGGSHDATPSGRGQDLDPVLEFDDVHLSFAGVKAINGVSFDVGERELFAIIGPNGAGKTSIFNVLSGVYRPQRAASRSTAPTCSASARTGSPSSGWPGPSRTWSCSAT